MDKRALLKAETLERAEQGVAMHAQRVSSANIARVFGNGAADFIRVLIKHGEQAGEEAFV